MLFIALSAVGCTSAPSSIGDLGTKPIDMSTDMDGGSDLGGCAGMSSACPAAMPICDTTGACRTCSGPSDDGACMMRSSSLPRCGAAGTCVECRTSSDCKNATKPICGGDGSCRACIATSECPSSVCILMGASAGQCADANQVAWVDNNNCAGGNGQQSSSPLCDIDSAISNLPGRPYIHVDGSAAPYPAVTKLQATSTNIGPLQISGPGIVASPTARVFTAGADSFLVSTAGAASVTVVLEGLEMGGDSVSNGKYGIDTLNSGTGTITVTVTGCAIHNNSSGGINLTNGTTYTIVNSIIDNNSSSLSSGVTLGNGSTGIFAFNTIAKNHVSSGPGGIDCGTIGAMKAIVNSIVWGNDLDTTGGSQLGSKCTLSSVVTGTADNQGIKLDPAFVSTAGFDFHLDVSSSSAQSANAACCIDKITSDPGTPLKNVDVNGTIRPKGNGWDIGAHEVQ